MSASLRRSSTSAVATLPVSWARRLLLELVTHLGERRDLLAATARCRLLLLDLVVERAQLLVGRLDRAVLVVDELLDHHLRLDLRARLVGS